MVYVTLVISIMHLHKILSYEKFMFRVIYSTVKVLCKSMQVLLIS